MNVEVKAYDNPESVPVRTGLSSAEQQRHNQVAAQATDFEKDLHNIHFQVHQEEWSIPEKVPVHIARRHSGVLK